MKLGGEDKTGGRDSGEELAGALRR